MNKDQFPLLLLCSLITWWVGAGLMPLLPVYASQLGAPPTHVGLYLAFAFSALAIGSMSAGWLSTHLQSQRLPLVLVSLLAAPAIWLMGQVTHLWQLALCTATVWFGGGAALALISISVGRMAGADERGKRFGRLALTTALAGMLGAVTGPIADRWGYATLFTVVAVVWLVQVISAWGLTEKQPHPAHSPIRDPGARRSAVNGLFALLLTANLLFGIGTFVANIGRSLAMESLGFAATAVTVSAAVGSVAALLLNPWVGYLADRVHRPLLLALAYLAGALTLALLATTTTLAGFTVAALLMAITGTERVVASALVIDLLPTAALDEGLALIDAVRWAGGVIGFAGAGYAFQQWGVAAALWLTLLLPTAAIGLLVLAPWTRRTPALSTTVGLNKPRGQ